MKSIAQVAAELGNLPEKNDVRTRSLRTPKSSPAKEEDSAYRAAYGINGKRPFGRPLRAAFYLELPEPPKHGKDAAALYVQHIDRVIDMQCWPRYEQERLRVIRLRWLARAQGKDTRYVTLGTQGGVNDKNRRQSPGERTFNRVLDAIQTSAKVAGRVGRPAQKFMEDPKWPFGRSNPDRLL